MQVQNDPDLRFLTMDHPKPNQSEPKLREENTRGKEIRGRESFLFLGFVGRRDGKRRFIYTGKVKITSKKIEINVGLMSCE